VAFAASDTVVGILGYAIGGTVMSDIVNSDVIRWGKCAAGELADLSAAVGSAAVFPTTCTLGTRTGGSDPMPPVIVFAP
jgi:hypothetical protein